MRYLVTNGYKHINKPDKIIVTQTFNQQSFTVSIEKWIDIIGSVPPFVRNDVEISADEINKLKLDTRDE